jgi:2-oxoglutarate dehydrogenase E2 component (dihydrolipoamide succinyltransferase)
MGEFVKRDEQIATIETDKIDVPVNSPISGIVSQLFAQVGDTVSVGGELFKVDPSDAPEPVDSPKMDNVAKSEPTPKSQPILKSEPIKEPPKVAPKSQPKPVVPVTAAQPKSVVTAAQSEIPGLSIGSRNERTVKMNRMRLRIAERLKESQNTAASLTTFNEIDMSNLMALRSKYKDAVLETHQLKLGFMGAFIKASVHALQYLPAVNARIENDSIIYSDYVDISVAVATPKGLVTPVLRNCESLSIVEAEQALAQMAQKAKSNAISLEDMAGGTFTISNGGVFGSLYGTPIINSPQSAILGMHAIKERPVVVNGKVFGTNQD